MTKTSTSVVGIDLGNNILKAVKLQKKGLQYALVRAWMLPLASQGSVTEQSLGTQLKDLAAQVKAAGSEVHFTVNSPNSTVRYVDFPQIPLQEVRNVLQLNSTQYLRQNFENYTFDACPLDAEALAAFQGKAKGKKGAATSSGHKVKILAGGIAKGEVMLYFHASRRAGMKPRSLQLAPVSLMNCFEAAYPEIFKHQAVAILDLGFLSSSLTILDKGHPLLTRAVPSGAKQITEYIAQITGVDFAKAEAAKVQDDSNLSEAVTRTSVTLVREVRSSINFFEKNSDQAIGKVYVAGWIDGIECRDRNLKQGYWNCV
jgi:type IV pilus assembly protein PilM